MYVFLFDCVVVPDLLLVEKVEKKGVGMAWTWFHLVGSGIARNTRQLHVK